MKKRRQKRTESQSKKGTTRDETRKSIKIKVNNRRT
jgi:hypothetical protein